MRDSTVPLANSNLPYADKLTAGSFSMAFYSAGTGDKVSVSAVDFSSIPPGKKNFDPSVHSLENVRDAINASFPGKAQAVITDGKLSIKGLGDNRFQFPMIPAACWPDWALILSLRAMMPLPSKSMNPLRLILQKSEQLM